MAATALSICKTALLLIGADDINSFDSSSREALVCNAVYGVTRDSLLVKKNWSFTLQQASLTETTDTPLFGFSKVFQLPVDSLRVLGKDGAGNDYRIFKDKLFTDATTVDIIHQVDPSEENYPAYFVRVLEYKMAELLSTSLLQDESFSRMYEKKYLMAMREARAIDAQSQPTPRFPAQELILTAVRGGDG